MILYRFAHKKYVDDLSGLGAKLHGGRWNPPGTAVTYTSSHISLAILEMLANAGTIEQLQQLRLVQIELPDTVSTYEIKLSGLKKHWQQDFDYTQWMGQEMLRAGKSLLIKCPSAIVPQEANYLINPDHPEFKKIRLADVADFYFDRRLFHHPATSAAAV